jgi:hypothetical protein
VRRSRRNDELVTFACANGFGAEAEIQRSLEDVEALALAGMDMRGGDEALRLHDRLDADELAAGLGCGLVKDQHFAGDRVLESFSGPSRRAGLAGHRRGRGACREADVRAFDAEWALQEQADAEGESGEVDPVQAVEDALRDFPADEILVVGGASEDGGLDAALRTFGVPVIRVGGPLPLRLDDVRRERVRSIVFGRSRATPFVFFAGANLALAALSALITLIVSLVLWLR